MFLNNYNEFIFFISLLNLEKISFMKKISFFAFILIGLMACQPKDKQAPLIFLKGDNPYTVGSDNYYHITIPDQKVPFFENNVRYLYGVTNANSTQFIQESKIIDSIDPNFNVKYYLNKYKYSPYGTVTWNDSLWEVIKNDVVVDHYERF